MPLLELWILEMHSFVHFSLHALTYWAEILHMTLFTLLQITFEYRQFLLALCPFWTLEYSKYTVFRFFLLHVLTY